MKSKVPSLSKKEWINSEEPGFSEARRTQFVFGFSQSLWQCTQRVEACELFLHALLNMGDLKSFFLVQEADGQGKKILISVGIDTLLSFQESCEKKIAELLAGNGREGFDLVYFRNQPGLMLGVQPSEMGSVELAQYHFLLSQMRSFADWTARLSQTQQDLLVDDLTGLYNTKYLDELLLSEIDRASRLETKFCLMFIDLDGFKSINDTYGHLEGSHILKCLGKVLRRASRKIDTLFRFGGDEFVVLLLGANAMTGKMAAERIRQMIEREDFILTDRTTVVKLTASIGVVCFPDHAQDMKELLRSADEMMYKAKKVGKNRVVLFES